MIVIDRIEGDRAVLEIDGELIDVPVTALPAGAREGAVLVWSIGDANDALSEAEARLQRLRERSAHLTDSEEIEL